MKTLRLISVTLWAVALWSLWRWWFLRSGNSFDAGTLAWGTVPILLVSLWFPRMTAKKIAESEECSVQSRSLGTVPNGSLSLGTVPKGFVWKMYLAAGGVLLFAITRSVLPLTLGAMPALLCGLPLLMPEEMPQGKVSFPILGLAALGLPSLMIWDLFLGLPLRAVAVWMAGKLLGMFGFDVVREGFALVVDDVSVLLDVPCDGVKMLGMGMWLVLVLAQLFKLKFLRTCVLVLLAVVALVVCNAARVAALTWLIVRGHELSLTWHQLVGLAAMVPGVALCAWVACRMENGRWSMEKAVNSMDVARSGVSAWLPGVLLLIATVGSLWMGKMAGRRELETAPFPGWPAEFEGQTMVPDAMSPAEMGFVKDFPGKMGRFKAGDKVVIMRWTDRATHRVHSASTCLEETGWSILPLSVVHRNDGDWRAFDAEKDGETLHVREQAKSSTGETFPDVQSWFYHALLDRSNSTWWIVTVCSHEAEW